jgi:hypothetical protein
MVHDNKMRPPPHKREAGTVSGMRIVPLEVTGCTR